MLGRARSDGDTSRGRTLKSIGRTVGSIIPLKSIGRTVGSIIPPRTYGHLPKPLCSGAVVLPPCALICSDEVLLIAGLCARPGLCIAQIALLLQLYPLRQLHRSQGARN